MRQNGIEPTSMRQNGIEPISMRREGVEATWPGASAQVHEGYVGITHPLPLE